MSDSTQAAYDRARKLAQQGVKTVKTSGMSDAEAKATDAGINS